MKIASFPKMEGRSRNPYLFLLKNSLEKNQCKIENSNRNHLSLRWLIKNRGKVSILHLNWIQYHYINIEKKKLSVKLLANFLLNLILSRLLGYQIVWTMHNIHPHENRYPKIDLFLRRLLIHLTGVIITHCNYGREYLLKKFQRKKNVFVIPHPNYQEVYPNEITREAARNKLGILPAALVFLFLGEIRNYKGLTFLINTFKTYPNPNALLIIAGHALFPQTLDEINQQIGHDKRIMAHFSFIPDHELQNYYQAADTVILPFSDITMSGSLLLGMSFAKAIVAPAIGGITEYINSDSGILYNPSAESPLMEALQKCETLDLYRMGLSAYQSVKNYSWDQMGQSVSQIYLSLLK